MWPIGRHWYPSHRRSWAHWLSLNLIGGGRGDYTPGDIWQSLDFWLSWTARRVLLASNAWGCCLASHGVQDNAPHPSKNYLVPMSMVLWVASLELKQWAQEARVLIFQSHLTLGRLSFWVLIFKAGLPIRAHSQGTGREEAVRVKSSAQLLAQRRHSVNKWKPELSLLLFLLSSSSK